MKREELPKNPEIGDIVLVKYNAIGREFGVFVGEYTGIKSEYAGMIQYFLIGDKEIDTDSVIDWQIIKFNK